MIRPNSATDTILVIMIVAVLWTFGGCFDARAQADPEPTPTRWTVDGQLVCIGPGPVAITATPTLAPVVAPTPEPTAIATPRPLTVPCPPWRQCQYMPIVHGGAAVTGDVR